MISETKFYDETILTIECDLKYFSKCLDKYYEIRIPSEFIEYSKKMILEDLKKTGWKITLLKNGQIEQSICPICYNERHRRERIAFERLVYGS